jgi:hypothetical protein
VREWNVTVEEEEEEEEEDKERYDVSELLSPHNRVVMVVFFSKSFKCKLGFSAKTLDKQMSYSIR